MNLDLYFRDTAEGRVFYPYGVLRGGIIVGPDIERAVRRFISFWTAGVLLVAFLIYASIKALGIAHLAEALIVLVGLLIAIYVLGVSRITSNCQRATIRLTRSEFARIQGKSYSVGYIGFLLLTSVVLTIGSLFMVATTLHHPNSQTAAGAFGALFFGYGFFRFVAMARARRDPK